MEYTVNQLARLSGVSTRTLRYYDKIGLLKPAKVRSNKYRIYGSKEVDLLQQILFYKELGVPLEGVKEILSDPGYDKKKAMENHLQELIKRKEQIQQLIENVTLTIGTMNGGRDMSDTEKFNGFKNKLVEENEQKYGAEIRSKYGDSVIDVSNKKWKDMTEEQYQEVEKLSEQVNSTLKEALELGDPASELAQKACELHKQWLCYFWPEGMYSKEAHKGLGEMYVQDERFKEYYDKIVPGAAEFLRDALNIYCL